MNRNPPVVATATRNIGAILVDSGKLSAADAERVLRQQKENKLRFGDAALLLGLVTPQDIAQALAQQFDYPYLLKGESSVAAEVVAAYAPFSPPVESLRALRSQLMLRWFTGEANHKALAVCAAGRGEGRSYLAANLAVVFSQLGERTLLIDADLRRPRQHEIFGVENQSGLSNILSGRGGIECARRIDAFADLSLLPAGAPPPNPQELLGRPAFADLIETAAAHYDVVLIDTPAATECSDAQTIAMRARAALLLARKDTARLAATRQLADSLGGVGIHLVGAVLTEF